MSEEKVVAVTGVSKYWGANVAGFLNKRNREVQEINSTPEIRLRVIGIDVEVPRDNLDILDFVQMDIRNAMFPDFLASENVDVLIHLDFKHSYHRSETSFDFNVLGTMKVIGACTEASVGKIILMSSTSVYGAHPQNPSFITENHELEGSKNLGYTRDLVEIASFCAGYCRQASEIGVTILRFPNIIGMNSNTPLIHYLDQPLVPVLMGFDPMFQIIHEDDVINAVVHCTDQDIPGVFNVAAEGIFPLKQIIQKTGKIPLPIFHPFAYATTSILNAARMPVGRSVPIDWDYLRYPCIGDITRMERVMKFQPTFTAEEAIRQFNRQQKINHLEGEDSPLVNDEEYVHELIDLRKRLTTGENKYFQEIKNE